MRNGTIISLILALILGFCSCSSHPGDVKEIYVDPQATCVNIIRVTEDAATLDVDFDVINAKGIPQNVKTIVELFRHNLRLEKQSSTIVLQDTLALNFSFDIPNPDFGTKNDPELYVAKITLKAGWRVLDEYEQPFELYTFDFISKAHFDYSTTINDAEL